MPRRGLGAHALQSGWCHHRVRKSLAAEAMRCQLAVLRPCVELLVALSMSRLWVSTAVS